MDRFVMWLNDELNARSWSRSEAARRGGVSDALLSQIVNGQTRPGIKLCRGLAKAFGLPVEEVMERAGILPSHSDILPLVRDWSDRLRSLPAHLRPQVLDAIERIIEIAESK